MKRIYEDQTLQDCYEKGFDSAIKEPNETNCHFSLFSSPDKLKAWERGRKDGKKFVPKKEKKNER